MKAVKGLSSAHTENFRFFGCQQCCGSCIIFMYPHVFIHDKDRGRHCFKRFCKNIIHKTFLTNLRVFLKMLRPYHKMIVKVIQNYQKNFGYQHPGVNIGKELP